MRKQELASLVAANKPREKNLPSRLHAGLFGHIVLRLPPYMCDLSPIELALAKVKRLVGAYNR
jgi:transposase